MSIRKKPKNQRTTYTYHFADGRIVTLYPESRRPRDETEVTICEKLYVDDALIAELHRADDRIVYNDLKTVKRLLLIGRSQALKLGKEIIPEPKRLKIGTCPWTL